MARHSDNRWDTDSRLDRHNAVRPDGWSRLPGDSDYDEVAARRRRPPARGWLRTLALPLVVCIGLGALVIYIMMRMVEPG